MGEVLLTLRGAGRRAQLDVRGLDASAVTQLEHALLLSGAKPHAGGFTLPAIQFRRSASEMARLLQGLPVELDTGVEHLLRTRLSEVQARQSAEPHYAHSAPRRFSSAFRQVAASSVL